MNSPEKKPTFGQTYLREGTIAAISSAVGGAIAVVRLSGPDAFAIFSKIAGPKTTRPEHRKATRLMLPGIDDALVICFENPHSFTGEDLVEFHLHGGSFLCQLLMERLLSAGAAQALSGEFSFRAVRNGKLTLSQAEAIPDLISAANERAVELALEKLSGGLGKVVSLLLEDLRRVCVLAESAIDFSDQDLPELSLVSLKKQTIPLISSLKNLEDGFDRGVRIQEGVSLSFVGLPNAGKSSFFNRLLQEEVSIVSDIPGTTRDVVQDRITLRDSAHRSVTFRLQDTAGLRGSSDEIETEGVRRARKTAQSADLLFLVLDSSRISEPGYLDSTEAEWSLLCVPPEKTIGILNKADLILNGSPRSPEGASILSQIKTWLPVSSSTGAGVSLATDEAIKMALRVTSRQPQETLLTHLDHRDSVRNARECLERALQTEDLSLFAADLRGALRALARIAGETLPDDILGQIFSEFCIGK